MLYFKLWQLNFALKSYELKKSLVVILGVSCSAAELHSPPSCYKRLCNEKKNLPSEKPLILPNPLLQS